MTKAVNRERISSSAVGAPAEEPCHRPQQESKSLAAPAGPWVVSTSRRRVGGPRPHGQRFIPASHRALTENYLTAGIRWWAALAGRSEYGGLVTEVPDADQQEQLTPVFSEDDEDFEPPRVADDVPEADAIEQSIIVPLLEDDED